VTVLVFKIVMRPFRRKAQNFQDIMFESFLIVIISTYLTFTEPKTEKVNKGRANVLG